MKTKIFYMILALLCVGGQTMMAQNKGNNNKNNGKLRPTPEQMAQRQASRMAMTLMLDDATTAKFTPVYENYLKELRECRAMNRPEPSRDQEEKTAPEARPVPTDTDVEKRIEDRFAQCRKMLDIREKYYKEFRKILSPKQIDKIYQMERNGAHRFGRDFDRRKMQKQVRVHRNDRCPFGQR